MKKNKKEFRKYIGLEKNLQISIAILLDSLGVLWWHTPNGGRRNKLEASSFKKQGVKPGVSDCIILEPRGKYHGLAIELKTSTGKLSESQKTFLERAKIRGYKTAVCWGIEETEHVVKEYLKQEKPPTQER